MEEDLRGVLSDEVDIKIMIGMVETTCQSVVARSLGVSQGFVRYRFFRTISRMKRMRGMDLYVDLFEAVAQNLGVLRDTCRFNWSEEVIYSVC